jgi:hypothetical protein
VRRRLCDEVWPNVYLSPTNQLSRRLLGLSGLLLCH